MSKTLNDYVLGDMIAHYTLEENGLVGFILLPENLGLAKDLPKACMTENLVQLKYQGDIYNETYAGGLSLRNGQSTRELLYDSQVKTKEGDRTIIKTFLKDKRGYEVVNILSYDEGSSYVKIRNVFTNKSGAAVSLELFESFSMGGISPYVEGDAHDSLDLYRVRSTWSGEGRLCRDTFEDLCLETAWAHHAVRCERYGQTGSMPTNHFFPMGIIYDKKSKVYWGAQVANNGPWQIEVYRRDEGVGFSGGLCDREFGHWVKEIKPEETFITPEALLSVAHIDLAREKDFEEAQDAGVDLFMQRLTQDGHRTVMTGVESEKELPVMFNEYCTTWGCPSDENITGILEAIKDKGFSYFVIDCGWYKQDGIPWDRGMGDYDVSKTLFPEGLDKTIAKIKAAGMVPGVWFEIDNVASESKAYKLEDHLLKRDGKTLTTYARRFWDLNDPWVEDYLTRKVIGTLKEYGFGYMKMDYNESIGIGCDGCESLGEGLRRNEEASANFIRKVKEEIPGIILENCASGGNRLEPLMMSLCSMASFSDAHECVEIPVIAAYLHRVIHPAQSQIWAVIRQTDSVRRITYSVANTLLGRMCLSGDVTALSKDQWRAIDEGIAFYKEVAGIIRDGKSLIYGPKQSSMRHPKDYQAVVRYTDDESLVVVHSFEGGYEGTISLPVFPGMSVDNLKLAGVYAEDCNKDKVSIKDGKLCLSLKNEFEAIAIHIKK